MDSGEARTGPSGLFTVFSETFLFSEWIATSSSMRLTTCYKSFHEHPCCASVST